MRRDLPEPADDGDRKLLSDIHEFGWHVVNVPGDERAPAWCFTVGLQHSYGHPELVIVGLPLDTGHAVLNIAGETIKRGGSFIADRSYDEFLVGYACVLRAMDKRWYRSFLGYGLWFYRGPNFECLQLFWPDRSGQMPWSPTASDWLRANQPRLFESSVEAAGVEALLEVLEA